LRVVNVQSATHSNQLDEPRGFVVVADIEGERQALLAGLRFADGKAEHPNNIPYAELGIRDVIPST
jgi:hypothetical protein